MPPERRFKCPLPEGVRLSLKAKDLGILCKSYRFNFPPFRQNLSVLPPPLIGKAIYNSRRILMKIAIDGPAGAGKSAAAKAVAKELDFIYVDTGALYRGIGLYVIRKGKNPASIEEVVPLLAEIRIEMRHIEREQHIFLNGDDVSDKIRTESVSAAASAVSAIPAVRDFLFDMQRDIAEKNSVIMDGRDIGTVVLPDAELKIFLTAKPEVRAERRVKQLAEKGIEANFDDVLADVMQRDYNDSNRDFRPLRLADDGILLDNSELSFEETVERIISLAKERHA